jgi:hypothetical protein
MKEQMRQKCKYFGLTYAGFWDEKHWGFIEIPKKEIKVGGNKWEIIPRMYQTYNINI